MERSQRDNLCGGGPDVEEFHFAEEITWIEDGNRVSITHNGCLPLSDNLQGLSRLGPGPNCLGNLHVALDEAFFKLDNKGKALDSCQLSKKWHTCQRCLQQALSIQALKVSDKARQHRQEG